MKKIERRAMICVLLALTLLGGVGYFCYSYYLNADDWASYEGNRDVYTDGDLAKGAVYDVDGELLLQNTADGPIYHKNATVRKALMHVTGDKDNNVSTGANRAFTDELIGYDLINGVYSLNNAGEDITLTLDADACATAYEAMNGRKGAVGVYNYKTGEIVCMVSTPTFDPKDPPSSPEDGVFINRFTSSTFAPGSIFKLVTSIASIESLEDAYTYKLNCTGVEDYGHGDKVTDLAPHGNVGLGQALQVSCNCYFGRLAEKVGNDTLRKYTSKLLLDESLDINGIKTEPGTFEFPDGGLNLAWAGIGQYHDMVNPCAMMVFMGGIANDGDAVMPTIISPSTYVTKKVAEFSKTELKFSTEAMMEETTARSMQDLMADNADYYETYATGDISDLALCAKSGTAEVGTGREPNAWFVGFLNDDENPYAFAVVIENGGYGTWEAGPVAVSVLRDIIRKNKDE